MAKRKRPDPVVEQLRALNGGGISALLAAESLVDDRGWIQIRVSNARKRLYAEAAQAEGFIHGGKPNISAWLIALADAALK